MMNMVLEQNSKSVGTQDNNTHLFRLPKQNMVKNALPKQNMVKNALPKQNMVKNALPKHTHKGSGVINRKYQHINTKQYAKQDTKQDNVINIHEIKEQEKEKESESSDESSVESSDESSVESCESIDSDNDTDYYSENEEKLEGQPENKEIRLGNMIIDHTGITFPDGSKLLSASLLKGPITGFVSGTEILTSKGYKKIENLNKGDKVITVGNIYKNANLEMKKMQESAIIWISKIKINVLEKQTLPICIKKNTFGKNKPYKNIYLSPHTAIYLYGKKKTCNTLKTIQNKANQASEKDGNTEKKESKVTTLISQMDDYKNNNKDLYYYHLELEYHEAIMVNGLISESFVDWNGIRDYYE